jgi:hypothetical protein
VDGDVDAQGGDPGGPADRFPEGLELAVLLRLERHRGQLAAVGVDHRGDGDGLVDQVAAGEQPAARGGVGRDEVQELAGPPAQDQRGAAVILSAPHMDAAEHTDLADRPVRTPDQPVQPGLVTDRETDTGQGRPHHITSHRAQDPGGLVPDCDPWRARRGRCHPAT